MSAEKLKAFVDAFDTKRADTEARAIIEAATAAGGAAGSTPASAEGLFDALCVHVSLAAMDNQPLSSLRGALATFKNALGASSFERAAIKYVEGTAALRQTKQIARVRFQEALEEDPHFVVARLGLAVVAYQEQQWKPCITELKAVLAALGTYAPNIVRVLLGVCSLRVGEDKHARRCIKRALEVDPSDPAALLAQFAIHAHYREEADAARVVRQLHAVAPSTLVQQRVNDMFFFRNVAKGDSYVAEHDAQLAARIAKTRAEAAAAHDVAGEAYAELQLARLHHARGRLVDAVAGYERALALAPTLAAAAVHRAEALHGLGRRDDCLRQVMEALTQREKDPRLLQMATALFSTRGDHTRAVALAQTLLASAAKKTPEAWAINAWVNRLDAAEFGAASTFAAAARAKVHRAEDHALSLNAAAMSNDAAAVARVATAALGIRDIDQAIAAATAIGPREFPYFFNYALALEKSSPDRARAVYVRLVKGAPSELATYERLAHLAQRAGRGAEALKWAALLEAASPDGSAAASSSGAVLKAWVLKNHGHAEEALKVVRTAAEKHRDEALGLCTGALYLWDAASSESNKEAKLQRAMNGFFHALRHDRGNVLAAHGAACCIASQGFHAHAGVLLERVAEVDCNDEACKRNIREHRFNVLVATRAYRAAIAALPRDSALTRWQRCALALCHSSVAQHVEAIAALDVALAEHPKDATVCFYLVFTLLAAAIDVVLSPKPVTQAAGAAALEYIGRALELTPYARNVKSAEQKTALRRMDVFVRKGTLEKAVRKRMEDFSREAEDLRRDEAAWRNAATQLAQERDAIAHEATQQELVRQQTRANSSRTLRIYPLETITRCEVYDSSTLAFWSKSSVDIEPRRIRLQSNKYTTNTLLDTVTAATVQFKEMGGRSRPAESFKASEQATEKKKGLVDWVNLIKPGNEEKDHWVPDEAVTKCTACGTDFGAFVRRHHCRNCGDIFCDKCTQGRTALTAEENAPQVRVCDRCMAEVTQRLANAKDLASKPAGLHSHEDLAKKLKDEMERNRRSSGSKSDGSGKRMKEVACPTCTVHLQVQVPSSGSETIECGVCQHPFLVSAH